MGASSRAGRRAFPPGSHALDPEVRPVIVIRPRARGCERRVGREPRPAPEPLGDGRRAMRPDARDRQCPVSVRAGAGDPPGPDHAGISLRGAEGGAAGGFMFPGASVRPRTQRLRGLGAGRVVLNWLDCLLAFNTLRDGTGRVDRRGRGWMTGTRVRDRVSPHSSSCSTCPSTDELDTRTPWPLALRTCAPCRMREDDNAVTPLLRIP